MLGVRDPYTVFSAHAEVVPRMRYCDSSCAGILRARGGSSLHHLWLDPVGWYSPRTRR